MNLPYLGALRPVVLRLLACLCFVAVPFSLGGSMAARAAGAYGSSASAQDVLKATLRNGLRVVIVRNALAPVTSTDMTYLVGSRDDPADFPGMAHAQEHMLFRGTPNLSTSELGTVATALGGAFNASTADTITEYQFTVPAADLDAVLRIESDRMRDVLDAQSEWQNERGAIEQEVLRDDSSPGGDFFRYARATAFAGSGYQHDGVGTTSAFDRLTGPRIKQFYETWYAPNNAVFVIAGDIDPQRTLAQVRARFESIPRRNVPAHPVAHLAPIKRTVTKRLTTLVYPLAVVGYRFPGSNSPDFLPSFVLQDILDSQRGALHALMETGEALESGWTSTPYLPEGQLSFATAALRPGADPAAMTERLERILHDIARHGVSRELFEASKRRLIAGQELSRNSIESLASDWATTIAVDDEPSIAHEQDLIAAVTFDQVNDVARRYIDPAHAIVSSLTPSAGASQNAAPNPPQQGPEKPLDAHSAVAQLPPWATDLLQHVKVPPSSTAPTQMRLSNGITLIVQPESISNSVFLYGNIRTQPSLQEPVGGEGTSRVLEAMFDYGTRTKDRFAFQRSLDDIDSLVSGGSSFGVQSTAPSFARAVALLGENELDPRFDQTTFEMARRRAAEELATTLGGTAAVATQRAAAKLLPPGDPELRIPSVASIQGLSLDDVRAYYTKTFRPDLTTIVVVGNVSPAAARAAVERAFGKWHASGLPPNLELPPIPMNPAADVNLPIPSLEEDNVSFQQIVPLGRSAPQLYPLQLGNAILGGGSVGPEQSRLFRDIRQNAGLVYTISSSLSTQDSRSLFEISFGCSPGNESRIASLIDDEVARMQHEPVGDFELSLMKASIVRKTLIADSSATSIGGSLLGAAVHGQPLDQQRIDARAILATDARAIQSAFSSYIHPGNFVRLVQGPQS